MYTITAKVRFTAIFTSISRYVFGAMFWTWIAAGSSTFRKYSLVTANKLCYMFSTKI